MNENRRTPRLLELDGLRGVAILLVVFYHYIVQHLQTQPGSLPAYVQKYFSICWMGVDIFFVLSGFLVGGILMDQRRATNLFPVFYLRRALRIVPPYLLFLAALMLALVWWNHARPAGLGWLVEDEFPLWSFLLYLQNFLMALSGKFGPNFAAPTWSLAVEEQFYLLFPLLVYFCPPKKLPAALVFFAVSAPLLRVALFFVSTHQNVAAYVLLPTRWDTLALGALAAWCVRDAGAVSWVRSHVTLLRSGLVAAWLGVAVLPLLGWNQFSLGMSAVGLTLIALGAAALILLLATGLAPWLAHLMRNRVLRYFGKISYSFYLFHQAVVGLVFVLIFKTEPIIATPWHALAVVGALAATTLLAQLTWLLFEKRSIQFGHRFAYRGPSPI